MALPEGVDYYTVKEVSDHFRISPMTIYRHVRKGELESVVMGGTIRIPARAIDALVPTIDHTEVRVQISGAFADEEAVPYLGLGSADARDGE